MVNLDLLSIIIFYSLLFLFFLKYKDRFTIQAKIFALYKTKLGLNVMNKIAKVAPRLQKFVANIGVLVGFTGMAYILYFLIKETLKLVFVPGTPPALAPVLPGISIPGLPTLSFWHWVITIFIAAVVHEFSHGVVARLYNIKVKSSGFAFLGPILAAFVEPDEKQMNKRPAMQQMSVFAAGPFSNLILGFLVLLFISFVSGPYLAGWSVGTGIGVGSLAEGFPMVETGIETPFVITAINGEETLDIVQFVDATKGIAPGDSVVFTTDKGDYTITAGINPDDTTKGYFGISELMQESELKAEFAHLRALSNFLLWFQVLLLWLFIINIGIGLFNLLPLGPVDGGRMFYSLALVVTKSKVKANKALGIISMLCLALIVINMIPWLNKLFLWVWAGFGFLVALLV